MVTSDKKGAGVLSERSKAHEGDMLVSQVADIRRELDEQIKEMKELSAVTIAAIEKFRKINADEISDRLSSIDERMKKLDDHALAVDKKLADIETFTKRKSKAAECMNEEHKTAKSRASYPSHCSHMEDKAADIRLPDIPSNEAVHPDRNDSRAHVIETTMDKADGKVKDEVSETIMSYEIRNMAKPEENEGNIFTKLMSKVKPAHRKESLEQPKMAILEDKGILYDNIMDESTKKDFAVPTAPEQASEDNVAREMVKIEAAEQPVMEEKSAMAKKEDADLLAVDEREVRPKMDEMLSQAKQMLVEKRFADATEIYLKLSDAYEKNKGNPSVQELRADVDELYEKISSSLLSNLMGTDNGKKMSIFDQNR